MAQPGHDACQLNLLSDVELLGLPLADGLFCDDSHGACPGGPQPLGMAHAAELVGVELLDHLLLGTASR